MALVITFSVLIVAKTTVADTSEISSKEKEDQFFSTINSSNKNVFLIGSSHVGVLNATIINQMVLNSVANNTDKPILVYNLAKPSDTPDKRLGEIDRIISSKPEIIFYGISYPDLSDRLKKESVFPDPQVILSDTIYSHFVDILPANPQLLTRTQINEIIHPGGNPQIIYNPNTPFFRYLPTLDILSDDKLKEQNWEDPGHIRRGTAMDIIIQKAQDHDIELVLFKTPLHKYYLEHLSDEQIENFSTTLEDYANTYEIKIYDFEDKYSELEIWTDTDHISYDKTVTVYNNDVAEMIVAELES